MIRSRQVSSRVIKLILTLTLSCVLLILISGCDGTDATSTTTPITVTDASIQAIRVFDTQVRRYGWTDEGKVWYALDSGNDLQWFTFDPTNNETALWVAPEPSQEVMALISEDGKIEVLQTILSPSGEKVLYEQQPEDFERPSFETPIPDYFDPAELWIAQADGSQRSLISARFANKCGMLDPEADWLRDETLVIGTCSPYIGFQGFFLVDINNHSLTMLYFYPDLPEGYQETPYQAVVSNDEQWWAFTVTAGRQLWMLPIEELGEFAGESISTSYRLPTEKVVYSPQWSPHDRWIYYWRSPFFGPDSDFYDIDLMRIEIASGTIEEVLSKRELIDQLGWTIYEQIGKSYGFAPDWRLSPDGRHGLLSLNKSAGQPGGLFLFVLEN